MRKAADVGGRFVKLTMIAYNGDMNTLGQTKARRESMPATGDHEIVRQHLRSHPDGFGVVRPGPQPGEVVYVREAYRHIPRDELPRRIPWSVWRESICPDLAPLRPKAGGMLRVGDAIGSTIKSVTGRPPCGGCRRRRQWLNRLPFRVHGRRISDS